MSNDGFTLTKEEQDFLNKYRMLSEEWKKFIRDFITVSREEQNCSDTLKKMLAANLITQEMYESAMDIIRENHLL